MGDGSTGRRSLPLLSTLDMLVMLVMLAMLVMLTMLVTLLLAALLIVTPLLLLAAPLLLLLLAALTFDTLLPVALGESSSLPSSLPSPSFWFMRWSVRWSMLWSMRCFFRCFRSRANDRGAKSYIIMSRQACCNVVRRPSTEISSNPSLQCMIAARHRFLTF
jgi:hypothetical protein